MTSVYSKNLQILNAQQFKRAIEASGEPYLYLGFGKVTEWPNENAPPQADTSVDAFNDVWKNLIGAKLIKGNDARLVVRRFDWEPGTNYVAYDDCTCSLDMNDANNNFYVVTDEWKVFKCLSNNNGGLSTTKPTSTTPDTVTRLDDKYIWKYMYSLTDEERLRFTTDKYIPVKTLTEDNGSIQWQVQNTAVQGSIQTIRLISGGSNYSNSSPPTITITGDGVNANAIADINTTTNMVESIRILTPGSGYTYANVSITSAVGSGAQAQVILSPSGGHGSNPEEELGASFVMINPTLKGTEGGILDVANEFRQISILKNPLIRGTKTFASNSAYSQTTTVFLSEGTTEYLEDEIVFQGVDLDSSSFRGTVASWNSSNSVLELVNVSGSITTDPLIGFTSRSARYVQNSIPLDLQPYSGSLIYINNIKAIQRSSDQTEDFKIVISF